MSTLASMTTHTVETHPSVNGIAFGCSEMTLTERLGAPDKRARNYTGEVELLYAETIYRCLNDRFVECTLPDAGPIRVNGTHILNLFKWLAAQEGTVDRARFRISLKLGIAYDYRFEDGSITVFERGHWDHLLQA